MNLGSAEVVHGNARHLPLDDNSVDLIVTSPPYFALRSYQDDGEHYDGQIGDEATPNEFVDALIEVTRESMRVLRDTGSLWVNLGDKYGRGTRSTVSLGPNAKTGRGASENVIATGYAKSLIGIPWRYAIRCIDELGLVLRAEVIWEKPNGLPESVTDRVRRSHETWFHFTLNQRYFANVDPIREPLIGATGLAANSFYRTNGRADLVPGKTYTQHRTDRPNVAVGNRELGRVPGSVWSINTEPLHVPEELGIDHFAAFPTEWPKRIIQGWCPEGGTVLDPFGGTGTTAMVAKALGRHGISVDLSADYCRLAEWRTNDRDQLAKVLGIAKAEQPAEDQMSLFGAFSLG
jgi:DNA modification methylase